MASPMRLGGEESCEAHNLANRVRFPEPLPSQQEAPAAGGSPIFYESKAGVCAWVALVACRAYLPYIVLTVRSYPSLARSGEGGAGGRDLPALAVSSQTR